MTTKKMSRRQFLAASAAGAAGLILVSCTPATPTSGANGAAPTVAGSPTTKAVAVPTATTAAPAAAGNKSARSFVEPPYLADRVKAGKLPPIDERLPVDVFVVGPGTLIQEQYGTWQNGQYGGELDVVALYATPFLMMLGQGSTTLRSPSQSTQVSKANIFNSWSVSDDYTTYKFGLRKGLRWSDGEPVTTEDVRFLFEDLYQDPDVQRAWPSDLLTQGNAALGPAKLQIQDEYNFTFTFSKPYGYFIASLNSWIPGYDILIKPAHYLKRFHKKYASPESLNAELKKANETDWVKLLNTRDNSHWGVGEISQQGEPTLGAWILTEVSETRRVFERNPYYWHVDSNGLQLPYVDKVVNTIVTDDTARLNTIFSGKISIAAGNDVTMMQMPTLAQTATQSNKRIFYTGSFNYPIMLFLNQDYEYDKEGSVWQKLINDPDRRFGKAIAAAMDPEEVNKSIYFGKYGKPFMNATGPDLALANKLLDELGMDKKGSDGFRLGPDGNPFIFRLTPNNEQADEMPIAELLKTQLGRAGLNVQIEVIDFTLWNQRATANQISASLKWNDGEAWYTGMSEDYLPIHKGPWSPATWLYFTTNGKDGRKPPDYIQKFYDLHTSRKAFPPESKQGQDIYQKLWQWLSDNYVMIPTVGHQVKPNLVDTKLQNLPNDGAPFDLDVYINSEGYWYKS